MGWLETLLLYDVDLLVVASSSKKKYWGNGVTSGDFKNPIEQVFAACVEETCVFDVLIHANSIPNDRKVSVALVITAAGVVTGPVEMPLDWDSYLEPNVPYKPTHDVVDLFSNTTLLY